MWFAVALLGGASPFLTATFAALFREVLASERQGSKDRLVKAVKRAYAEGCSDTLAALGVKLEG